MHLEPVKETLALSAACLTLAELLARKYLGREVQLFLFLFPLGMLWKG